MRRRLCPWGHGQRWPTHRAWGRVAGPPPDGGPSGPRDGVLHLHPPRPRPPAAENAMGQLPAGELTVAWRSVASGMASLEIDANGVASRLERLADPEYVGLVDSEGRLRDRRRVIDEVAVEGARTVANNPVPA